MVYLDDIQFRPCFKCGREVPFAIQTKVDGKRQWVCASCLYDLRKREVP